MNKSTLFLLSIFSTINFSCCAMETVEYGAYQLSNVVSNLIAYAQQEPTKSKSSEEVYRESLIKFNANAELLKNNLKNKQHRWDMAQNLHPIKQEISFIVS